MKSIAANDDRGIKQSMLRYFKHVAIFIDKHYRKKNVRAALLICCLNITIS